MTYACFDDRWDEHPKYADLELEHLGLIACAIVYCNRLLTDGFLPMKAVRSFGAKGVGPKLAARLVDDGIWKKRDGGFEIVGYLDHNPSREDVVARRHERSQAGKRGGYAKAKAMAAVRPAPSNGRSSSQALVSTNVLPSPIRSNKEEIRAVDPPQDHEARAREGESGALSPEELQALRSADQNARARLADAAAPVQVSTAFFENDLKKAGGEKA